MGVEKNDIWLTTVDVDASCFESETFNSFIIEEEECFKSVRTELNYSKLTILSIFSILPCKKSFLKTQKSTEIMLLTLLIR